MERKNARQAKKKNKIKYWKNKNKNKKQKGACEILRNVDIFEDLKKSVKGEEIAIEESHNLSYNKLSRQPLLLGECSKKAMKDNSLLINFMKNKNSHSQTNSEVIDHSYLMRKNQKIYKHNNHKYQNHNEIIHENNDNNNESNNSNNNNEWQ